jgi:hypothetical protein
MEKLISKSFTTVKSGGFPFLGVLVTECKYNIQTILAVESQCMKASA